jgi:hypothetical protein
MIERRGGVFGVDLTNVRDSVVDRFTRYEAGGEFLEELKTSSKVFEAFLT